MFRLTMTLVVMFFVAVGQVFAVSTLSIDDLVSALIQNESAGNDHAIGDKKLKHKAYGCLQVRQPCVDDVNQRYGTHIKAEDCLGNRELSIWVCKAYISMYATEKRLGHTPTLQDMARIWNGGPNGWQSSKTLGYWADVCKFLPK